MFQNLAPKIRALLLYLGKAPVLLKSLSLHLQSQVIKHYAGNVTYLIAGFLEKCRDRLPLDSQEMLQGSRASLIAFMTECVPG